MTGYRNNDVRREAVARVLVLTRAAIDTLVRVRSIVVSPNAIRGGEADETRARWDDARQSMRALEVALREIDVALEPEFALLDRSARVPDPVGLWQRFQASMKWGPWEDGHLDTGFVAEAITRLDEIVRDLESELGE